MNTFKSYNLPDILQQMLEKNNFTTPTPIQEKSLPFTLEGKDLLGSAKTGTGKTIAFTLPLIKKLIESKDAYGVIITPTRELASQIQKSVLTLINRNMHIRTALLIGGEPIGKQLRQLSFKPRIIIGTPGRITDHIKRKTLPIENTNILILDETDRMLDMGFEPQIKDIVGCISDNRQTMLFSATFPPHIEKLANKYLKNPEKIFIGDTSKAAEHIEQEVVNVTQDDKQPTLLKHLEAHEGSVIVFTKTKFGADRVARFLRSQKEKAEALHGNLRHKKRETLVTLFRKKKYRVLVATDIAARGLDISHIETVINYDIPQCAEDYIHRIGRTGRAGAEGKALCYVTPPEKKQWASITRVLNRKENEEYVNSSAKPYNPRRRSVSGRRGNFKRDGFKKTFDRNDRSERRSFGEGTRKKRSFGESSSRKPYDGQKKRSYKSRFTEPKSSF